MSATKETIWKVPAYLLYVQPPLTKAAVAAAERELGYKLPAEYLDLLKMQNGGSIRYSLPGLSHDRILGIGPYDQSLMGFDWEEVQEYVSFPLEGLVPFDGDGHWYLCLDYRQSTGAPTVTCLDIECDEQTLIADSFADYLGKLKLKVEDKYVVEAVSDIEQLKAELSAALGLVFEPAETFNYGYPNHRGLLGASQYVWLSPNTVPRGFIRSNEPRFAELKDLLPGLASRYPEAPPDSCTLSATDALLARVVQACIQSGRVTRPLRDYVFGG